MGSKTRAATVFTREAVDASILRRRPGAAVAALREKGSKTMDHITSVMTRTNERRRGFRSVRAVLLAVGAGLLGASDAHSASTELHVDIAGVVPLTSIEAGPAGQPLKIYPAPGRQLKFVSAVTLNLDPAPGCTYDLRLGFDDGTRTQMRGVNACALKQISVAAAESEEGLFDKGDPTWLKLSNEDTSNPIKSVFFVPTDSEGNSKLRAGSKNWGDNRLQAEIAPGGSFVLQRPQGTTCQADLAVGYGNEHWVVYSNQNVCTVTELSFVAPAAKAQPAASSSSGDDASATTSTSETETTIAVPPEANYADEKTDWGIQPQSVLNDQAAGHTPLTVPGATTITTAQLARMLADGKKPLLIDALKTEPHETIAGAHRLWFAASSGSLDDDVGKLVGAVLGKLTGRDAGYPIVVFCVNSSCWESYNATLRTLAAGYTNVYWYRGGLDAWAGAKLPLSFSLDDFLK